MANIVEYREINLDDLVIGKGQVRTENTNAEIDSLAESIKVQGLLQPIVVCAAKEEGKWEILTGQRRFLAHKLLEKTNIAAAVLSGKVEEAEAKAISITENLIRRKLTGKELKDGILFLYNRYGSVKDVVKTTGLPDAKVRENIKYHRLIQELKQKVNDGEVDINIALKAQDASLDNEGNPNSELATKLVEGMKDMTDIQRRKVVEVRRKNPDKPVDDAIEQAKSAARVSQILITVSQSTHAAVRKYATSEDVTQDAAAAKLIEEALAGHGLLEE